MSSLIEAGSNCKHGCIYSWYPHAFFDGLAAAVNLEGGSEETKSSGLTSQLAPNAYEVSTFLLIMMSTLFPI